MTLFPLADCCKMLAIDPKTLHRWLSHSNMPLHVHPTDARLKCLTAQHVWQLATLHERPMQPHAAAPLMRVEGASSLLQPEISPPAEPILDSALGKTLSTLPAPILQEADLITRLSQLETKVSTLQEQLVQLALQLLQERDMRLERRITVLENLVEQKRGQESEREGSFPAGGDHVRLDAGQSQGRCLHPAELRARSRLIPLIEYGARGAYVVISAQEGELSLSPDSPEWFDWLATLSSFRFVGQQGRFSAYRKSSTSRHWSAYRTIHQHDYRHYLGTTNHLTIDCFERVAATLQSYMSSL